MTPLTPARFTAMTLQVEDVVPISPSLHGPEGDDPSWKDAGNPGVLMTKDADEDQTTPDTPTDNDAAETISANPAVPVADLPNSIEEVRELQPFDVSIALCWCRSTTPRRLVFC
jgi:hypothetical protein